MTITQRDPETPSTGRKLTTSQVAAVFGVTHHTVRKWADSGRIKCTRTLGGDRRFDAAYIYRMVENSRER